MQLVRRIVPLDGHGFSIDKAVELERGAQPGDLIENLLHLSIGEGDVVEAVDIPVVLKEDLLPVPDQILFGLVAQDLWFPAVFVYEQMDERRFKGGFVFK